ncbi:hypothetical protein NQZ68_018392 [Dissostichus eleginoides]|nr:hypothetical protein NQZ68_018392 [Dissostichus eleginoides]
MSSLELCSPQLLNWSCRGLERPHSEAVLLYTLFSSIAVITVALNLLVIISISHFRHLQTSPNLLLLSLAISDLLVGLLVMPVETSVGIMVLISIDRIVAINYPLQYTNKITRRRTELSVCVCWGCSFLYNVLILKDNFSLRDRHCNDSLHEFSYYSW